MLAKYPKDLLLLCSIKKSEFLNKN